MRRKRDAPPGYGELLLHSSIGFLTRLCPWERLHTKNFSVGRRAKQGEFINRGQGRRRREGKKRVGEGKGGHVGGWGAVERGRWIMFRFNCPFLIWLLAWVARSDVWAAHSNGTWSIAGLLVSLSDDLSPGLESLRRVCLINIKWGETLNASSDVWTEKLKHDRQTLSGGNHQRMSKLAYNCDMYERCFLALFTCRISRESHFALLLVHRKVIRFYKAITYAISATSYAILVPWICYNTTMLSITIPCCIFASLTLNRHSDGSIAV